MATTLSKLPYPSFFLFSIVFLFTQSQSTSAITPRFPASILRSQENLHSPAPISASLDTNREKSNHNQQQQLYREEFYTQVLDHFTFTPQSYQTFQQRYLVNDTYWGGAKNKAPIFVYTGNEGSIEWFTRNTGFMFDVAPRFNALLVFIEHRFYGKSIPFGGDVKKAYKDATTLGYLTSTQALADFATLIVDLKKNLSAIDSPVVVFGGSSGKCIGVVDLQCWQRGSGSSIRMWP